MNIEKEIIQQASKMSMQNGKEAFLSTEKFHYKLVIRVQ